MIKSIFDFKGLKNKVDLKRQNENKTSLLNTPASHITRKTVAACRANTGFPIRHIQVL
jgi:hypothetical protein